jgi:hypothetical protein
MLLVLAAVVTAGPALTRVVSGFLITGVFIFGAARTLDPSFQRLDYVGAAEFVDSQAQPGDVVVDVPTGYVGGVNGQPLLPGAFALEVELENPQRLVEAVDPEAMRAAVAEAAGGRIFLVGPAPLLELMRPEDLGLQPDPVAVRSLPGFIPLEVREYEVSPDAAGSK